MRIEETKIKVSELYEGYFNADEEGVIGYDEKLNIRPKYQREFVYKDEQRNEVIRTVKKGFPLNVFYWSKNEDGTFEMLDGQQRTISICEYLDGNFSVDGMLFDNLPEDVRKEILNYELYVYICTGTESEKLEWFKIINIAGEELTDQELRNAVYAGSWTSDAKRYFSKSGCPAYRLAEDYMTGSTIRQDYFQTALSWIADRDGIDITEYMARHMHDSDAKELWEYFRDVIEWVEKLFPHKRSQMKGIDWGKFYNKYKDNDYDPDEMEERIRELFANPDISRNRGVYEYLITGNERAVSMRAFPESDKLIMYERQNHKCTICGKTKEYSEMHGDHIVAWSKGGRTTLENGQMLCTECNLRKSAQ